MRGYTAKVGLRKPDLREWFNDTPTQRASRVLDQIRRESRREERSRRLDDGWVPFGWHVVYPDVQLEFDGSDGTGLPVWERNREWTTREASIESFAHAMARRRRMAQIEARPCCHTTGPLHHPACDQPKEDK